MWVKTSRTGDTEQQTDLVMILAGEGSLLIQLRGDNRRLPEIAAEFDETEWIRLEDGREYTEYTDLRIACRLDPNTVQLRLFQEG